MALPFASRFDRRPAPSQVEGVAILVLVDVDAHKPRIEAAKMSDLLVGGPAKVETQVGSLISREQLDRVLSAIRTAKALQAGTVWVNMYGYVGAGGPFCGNKESGFGWETAFETLSHYTQTKSVDIATAEKKTGGR